MEQTTLFPRQWSDAQADAIARLLRERSAQALWEALDICAGQEFSTAKNLPFVYLIRGNEMFVDRRDKSITRATVELAFQRALELGSEATGPKKLNCFGASYLYPIFKEFGII